MMPVANLVSPIASKPSWKHPTPAILPTRQRRKNRGADLGGADCRQQKYGPGRWRKLKGKAIIQYLDGKVVEAEIHWFEAAGIGRVEDKAIRDLEKRK